MNFDAITDLETLRSAASGCHDCGLRARCRGVVFGEGNPAAQLVLCGEGPGGDEDRLQRPFVGAAGQLLDRILACCGWERFTHTYILNVVKCRPPGNRTPTPEERAACFPILQAQLRILQPKIIVLLGSTAVQTLLDENGRITQMRGQWYQRDGIWYMPTYHPAALLRRPEWKKPVWHDFKLVIDKYRELVDPAHESPYYPLNARAEQGAHQVP